VHGLEVGDAAQLVNGVYKQTPAHTTSVTCPASQGPLDFTVIVAQHDGRVGGSFPFSLTLHTELPMRSSEAAAGVSMRAIPLSGLLEHATVVQGSWKLGQNCGGKIDAQTFVYNPQYSLTLAAPSRVVARLAAHVAEPVQLFLALPRKAADGAATAAVPWAGRLSGVSRDGCVLALQFPMYAHHGCGVDSSLETCLLFDTTNTLKGTAAPPPPPPPPPPATPAPPPDAPATRDVTVTIVGAQAPAAPAAALTVTVAVPTDTARTLLVAAMAQGVFVSPLHTKVVGGGRALDLATRLASINGAAFTVVAGTDALQRTKPLQDAVTAAAALAQQFIAGIHAARIAALQAASAAPPSIAAACVTLDEAVTQLLLRVDGIDCPTDDAKACRKALVSSLTMLHGAIDSCATDAQKPPPPPPSTAPAVVEAKAAALVPIAPLQLLPAGTYTLVLSCWTKATPGPYHLAVETDMPHALAEIPPEGHGYETATLQGQLRNDVFTSTGLPVVVPLASPVFSGSVHATLTFSGGAAGGAPAIFAARLLTLEADAMAQRSAVPMLLALYKCDETAGSATMATTSGGLSSSGAVLGPLHIDAGRRYQLLVLAGAPSTAKFVLRLFFSVKVTGLLC
jgi:hypothetical protein